MPRYACCQRAADARCRAMPAMQPLEEDMLPRADAAADALEERCRARMLLMRRAMPQAAARQNDAANMRYASMRATTERGITMITRERPNLSAQER